MSSFINYGRIIINWKLDNFSKDLLNPDIVPFLPPLHSPQFKVQMSNYETTKWEFVAHRTRTELALYLKKVNDSVGRLSLCTSYNYVVKYDIKIKDIFNAKFLNTSKGKVEVDGYEVKLGKIINFKESQRPRSHRICNQSIQVVIYLEVIKLKLDIAYVLNSTLSSHYEKMFNNENYSDFTITTNDDKEIKVHKNILSMRSPVFDAMINSSMVEGSEKKVKIDDIDGRSLTELIRFIYSGKVNEIDSIAEDLLYAANKYDMQDLKPLCVESFSLNLSSNNVLETLTLADLHQEEYLKKFCMDFIKWKYDEVKENQEWNELSSQTVKEILDFIMLSKKEENTITTNIKRTNQNTTQSANNNR